ncbi:MAG: elongation factor P [Chlamydiales bacterium]|nr:elongation factor P [Chlamydiales bacterium]NCF70336.1 elongation factor P [Chlamydiales bacterium]
MAQVATNDFKAGLKIEIDNQPFTIVFNQFVKPGKGQAFNRVKLKNLLNGKVIEKTFKSGDKVDVAEVEETTMRMLYVDGSDVVFMHDESFDQITLNIDNLGSTKEWLKDDTIYEIIFYNGEAISVEPPTFMELQVTETDPGVKGDTAQGRVMKPSILETGAKVQIPIFIDQDEIIKVDTRSGEYVSRASEN